MSSDKRVAYDILHVVSFFLRPGGVRTAFGPFHPRVALPRQPALSCVQKRLLAAAAGDHLIAPASPIASKFDLRNDSLGSLSSSSAQLCTFPKPTGPRDPSRRLLQRPSRCVFFANQDHNLVISDSEFQSKLPTWRYVFEEAFREAEPAALDANELEETHIEAGGCGTWSEIGGTA